MNDGIDEKVQVREKGYYLVTVHRTAAKEDACSASIKFQTFPVALTGRTGVSPATIAKVLESFANAMGATPETMDALHKAVFTIEDDVELKKLEGETT